MSTPPDIAMEMFTVARRAHARGLQSGSGGNLSARLPGGERILIKGTGGSFADLDPAALAEVVVATGEIVSGSPSSELHSHLEIYRRRPDVGGIFHCHAPWSIACAETLGDIPAIARHSLQKIGPVPVLTGMADPVAFTQAIGTLLEAQPALLAFVEARHGIFAFGPTVTAASYNAEQVEETAQVAMLVALGRGRGVPQ
ncbi:MAG TPA: class II aldolase/adducin family protein [Devosia sp.]|jgi:ribulose-5-phosphate 4-epimerase/fuculose-1-phosphate aldolase|nr:class II aldolase/adducin family protein [Devosia sp.]